MKRASASGIPPNGGMNNPVTFTVRVGDEVYVFILGRLIMKRWLSTGASRMFW